MSLSTANGAARNSGSFLGSCRCKWNVKETDTYNHLFSGASVSLTNICFYTVKTTGYYMNTVRNSHFLESVERSSIHFKNYSVRKLTDFPICLQSYYLNIHHRKKAKRDKCNRFREELKFCDYLLRQCIQIQEG